MASSRNRKAVVPKPFMIIMPIQTIVAGVAIYASTYVFGVGTIPFTLAVVAVSLTMT